MIKSYSSLSIRALVVAIFCIFFEGNAAAADSPLTEQFSVTLPKDVIISTGYKFWDAPAEIRWSPDSRYLAISGFQSGKLYLLDVRQRQLVDRNIRFKGGPPNIAWSADSSLIALINVDVALFQTVDGKEIARSSRLRYGPCASPDPRQAGAFTADGRFLWVSCGARSQQGSYRAANKLAVPSLDIVDSVDVDAVEPESLHTTWNERIVVTDGTVLLSSRLSACSGPSRPRTGLACSHYASCFDLQAKRPCFPSFLLGRPADLARAAIDLQLLPDSQRIVSLWQSTNELRNGPSDLAFEFHDFAGERIRQFGSPSDTGNLPVRDFVVAARGLVVGSLDDIDRKRGGIIAWNANSGGVLQSIATPPAWRLALSSDGRHLAVLMGLEVRVYSVSQI
jgi:WD40-like Beta Propeller Repeat